ncbi:hypothetical protein XELAEV_18036789mg [Xenopus laevis]|uniref:HMG box domain-containing protein n=1 Tax=Xenopus laevis TaxID=8355 RepID=A0A974CAY7_XENLA|nr:hypothetical protein XELAEV_18036789mg [Xenopus laevis]
MVSLLSRGVGGLLRSLAGINCSQVIRCTSVSSGILGLQCTPCRWFAKRSAPSDYLKRPLTAYLRFFIEQRPKLCKQYPETKLMDLTKIIALEWKGLPSADKEPYETVAKAEQKKYREEVKQYREALSPMQLELQREQRRQRLAKRKSVRKKRTKMKSLRDEWERLHNAQKQPYNHLAEDDKIRYENEMKSWEEQMMEIGRLDLVRLNQRKRFKKPRAARASSKSNTAKKALTESSSHNEGFRGPKQHEE